MRILQLDRALDQNLRDPVIVVALDGWTDAGRCGTTALELLQDGYESRVIGRFDPDALFDYRDRRPLLEIDRGLLGDPEWPALELVQVSTPETSLLVITGNEPDLSWRSLCADIVALAEEAGAKRFIGLGAVPGPVPHTRPTRVVVTGSREELLEQLGRSQERIVVPASCQVIIESALRDAGITTLGLWARIPHYVAGEFPEGAHALASRFAEHLDLALDLEELAADAEEHRERLDEAAGASEEITDHIAELEAAYDASIGDTPFTGPLPTGEEIAAELQRFLAQRGDAD